MFDPTTIHNSIKKIKKHSVELNEMNKNRKDKYSKEAENDFPRVNEVEKPVVEKEII